MISLSEGAQFLPRVTCRTALQYSVSVEVASGIGASGNSSIVWKHGNSKCGSICILWDRHCDMTDFRVPMMES